MKKFIFQTIGLFSFFLGLILLLYGIYDRFINDTKWISDRLSHTAKDQISPAIFIMFGTGIMLWGLFQYFIYKSPKPKKPLQDPASDPTSPDTISAQE